MKENVIDVIKQFTNEYMQTDECKNKVKQNLPIG